MNQAIQVAAIIFLIIGVIMSLIPFLPGIPLIFGTFLAFAIIDGFQRITTAFLISMLIITVASFFIDNLVGWIGAKKFGASKPGLWGAVLGGIIGVFINPVLGILLGPFVGAVAVELIISRRKLTGALKVGVGTIIGFLGGSILKFLLAIFMVAAFITKIY
jgi:uncharacterized protein YqgC (DUF456 family)